MKATEILKEEHRAIERMLAVLETAADQLDASERVRPGLFREAVDFVRTFADTCHHGKEEDTLFPRLEERGVPKEGGPLGMMLHEHDVGRAYIRTIDGAIAAYEEGDEAAARLISQNVRGYRELLIEHIWKEENVLFPMADQVLTAEDQRELEERFEQVEKEVIGRGVHERYHELLERVEREIRK